ncbi:MAG: hypothetical protein DMD97_05040 [Candidatus Rokuibacteriota bacterium]|nr:MAG: hypothetical protein DMD97_05040 [Candidatus Rokubacteria bacterium]
MSARVRTAVKQRVCILTDLVDSFEPYFAEHRGCAALAAAIVEAEQRDAAWAVAWMVCGGCGVRWERHLKLHA